MKDPKTNKVLEAVDRLEKTVDVNLSTSGPSLSKKMRRAKKKIPKEIKKRARELEKLKETTKHQPYILKHQEVACDRAIKKIAEFSKSEEEQIPRSSLVKQWLAGITVNYLLFLVALFGFWYIATQI